MSAFHSISGSPISSIAWTTAYQIGSATISCSVTTVQVGIVIGHGISANSSSATTVQACKRIRPTESNNSSTATLTGIGLFIGQTAALSQGSSTTVTNPTKITHGVSANSATTTTTPSASILISGNPSNLSSNVVSNSVAEALFVFYASVASSASTVSGMERVRVFQSAIQSSVNVESIGDILWETLDSEIGNPENIIWTELTQGNSELWTELSSGNSQTWTELSQGNSDAWTELTQGDSETWTELPKP